MSAMNKVLSCCSNETGSVNFSREPERPKPLRAFQTMLQIYRGEQRSHLAPLFRPFVAHVMTPLTCVTHTRG